MRMFITWGRIVVKMFGVIEKRQKMVGQRGMPWGGGCTRIMVIRVDDTNSRTSPGNQTMHRMHFEIIAEGRRWHAHCQDWYRDYQVSKPVRERISVSEN